MKALPVTPLSLAIEPSVPQAGAPAAETGAARFGRLVLQFFLVIAGLLLGAIAGLFIGEFTGLTRFIC